MNTSATLTADRLLTADELARRWQVEKAQVYRLARDNRIPVVQLGRYKRFRIEDILAFESVGGTGHGGDGD